MKNWKKRVRSLEINEQWDEAIDLLNEVKKNSKDDPAPWIILGYFLMNLIVEENEISYFKDMEDNFRESYKLFKDNAEYNFFFSNILQIYVFPLGIKNDNNSEFADFMENNSLKLDPKNFLYKFYYFNNLQDFFYNLRRGKKKIILKEKDEKILNYFKKKKKKILNIFLN